MANKGAKELPAAKMKIQPGPSGKMAKFTGVDAQKPFVTSRTNKGGKGAEFPSGGPSGKMQKFSGTKPQKSGRTSQS